MKKSAPSHTLLTTHLSRLKPGILGIAFALAAILATFVFSGGDFRLHANRAEAASRQQSTSNWVERTWSTENKWFGNSLDMSGNKTIGGARLADFNGVAAIGAAYVYTDDGTSWSREAQLRASDGAGEDWFGQSVGIDGNLAVVGAYKDDDNGTDSGSAYIFSGATGTWTEQAKLLPADGAAGDNFGDAVAIDGTTVVVGAPGHDPGGVAEAGAVYIFGYNGSAWAQQTKLLPGDGDATDGFGYSLAIEGNTLVVGAYLSGAGSGWGNGAVYVFTHDGSAWVETAKLVASRSSLYFGYDVAISGDTIAVGAQRENGEGCCFQSGAAYVFVNDGSGWVQQSRLVPPDPAEADYFGTAVTLWGDTLVVGTPNHDSLGSGAGAAYVFGRSGGAWSQQQKLGGSNSDADDYFGTDVAVETSRLAVGAFNKSTVYLFDNQAEQLQADFVASPTSGASPLVVAFSDTSSPTGTADGWHWQFGDGSVSTLQHPVYTYTVAGTYTVTLTVTDTETAQSSTLARSAYITATSDAGWAAIPTTTTPPVSGEYGMAYDSARDVVVLYGGNGSGWPYANSTWEFNGSDWVEVSTTQQPNAVYGTAMAYDAGRSVTVLFGGSDASDNELSETWEYNGTNWTQVAPAASPPERMGASLVYDGSYLYLFGGNDETTTYDDLWRYDGLTWSQVNVAMAPSPRTLSAIAYHSSEGKLYLFGGRDAGGNELADLWAYDPTTTSWTDITSAGPAARYAHSLTYDANSDSVVLVGGIDHAGDSLLTDTWHYHAPTGWVESAGSQATPAAAYHDTVYDQKSQALILFQESTTWIYR